MPQMVILLKRKPGMTKEEFRAHYESSHAKLGMKHQGHTMQEYRRYYTDTQFGLLPFGASTGEPDYDVITTISFASDEDMDAFMKAGQANMDEFVADEERFLDRAGGVGFIGTREVSL